MDKKIAIVISDFNSEITSKMQEVGEKEAEKLNVKIKKIVHVPGAFDIPLIAMSLIQREDIDAVVALGAVIKGDTDHDVVVVNECASRISQLSLSFSKPITLGVVGPNVTYEQCKARYEDYAKRAVSAAIRLIEAKKEAEE